MWQRILNLFGQIPHIGITKRNFLMISADIRKGTVIVSYKGKVRTGYFGDKTLRQMMSKPDDKSNTEGFLIALAQLIYQVRK